MSTGAIVVITICATIVILAGILSATTVKLNKIDNNKED